MRQQKIIKYVAIILAVAMLVTLFSGVGSLIMN